MAIGRSTLRSASRSTPPNASWDIYVAGPHLVGGTGTLDKQADSHTLLVIYPAHAICYQRVVICALLNTRF